jgi:DNA-binding transcriptional LysR family regulator
MIAVKIGPDITSVLVGSPKYFEAMPKPVHPRDLAGHRCIRFRFSSGVIYRWEFEKGGEAIEMSVDGPLILGEDRLVVEAAIAGAGLAFVFEEHAAAAIADGRLVRVMDDWSPSFDGFYLYYPSRRQMRPALRAFVDFFRIGA